MGSTVTPARLRPLESEPYRVFAALECLPAYLHFLGRAGLLSQPMLAAALRALQPLAAQALARGAALLSDPHPAANLAAAWAADRLAALSADPAAPPEVAPPPLASVAPAGRQAYTLRVTYRRDPAIWRVLELTSAHTLRDLHAALQDAFEFDNDHLYAFFLSGRAFDRASEYSEPAAGSGRGVAVRLSELGLRLKQTLLYVFDFGDQHEIDVQLIGLAPVEAGTLHPRLVDTHGQAPPQYPDLAEDWEDEASDLEDEDEADDEADEADE